ncbi:hypothetical protein [Gordonia sp. (in: high G+C Gram-positive bacteria)]|uniref:hypothetical protein n=1 Tax=Gordonia sp. (in: high G+C Gram-positive bacteria) TaxID=84139 RepID=UPI0039E6FF29
MADLTDDQITSALNRLIAAINPIIDVLSQRDITGLRGKSFQAAPKDGSLLRKAEHVAAKAVDLTALPGTKRWSELSMGQRAQWWVNRIGGLNTVGVAFPNIFGLWARRLPLSTVLGFVNQAMVLVAVAREYRVTDRGHQIELLASVLGGRDLHLTDVDAVPDAAPVEAKRKSIVRATWDIARTLQEGVGEMDKRPQPARPLRWLSNIPLIGAPINYVGERFALRRAVNMGRKWIVAHPDSISHAPAKPAETAAPAARLAADAPAEKPAPATKAPVKKPAKKVARKAAPAPPADPAE